MPREGFMAKAQWLFMSARLPVSKWKRAQELWASRVHFPLQDDRKPSFPSLKLESSRNLAPPDVSYTSSSKRIKDGLEAEF